MGGSLETGRGPVCPNASWEDRLKDSLPVGVEGSTKDKGSYGDTQREQVWALGLVLGPSRVWLCGEMSFNE